MALSTDCPPLRTDVAKTVEKLQGIERSATFEHQSVLHILGIRGQIIQNSQQVVMKRFSQLFQEE